MILGTFWYFNFPTEIYNLEYFTFKNGYSGYSESESELIANFEANNPEHIILRLKTLIEIYKEGSLYIYEGKKQIIIGTKSYTLFDYDFLLISEIEKILKEENVKIANNKVIENAKYYYIYNEEYQKSRYHWKGRFLQLEREELVNNNGECLKIRLNCHLDIKNKNSFISDLIIVCKENNIGALYYFETNLESDSNLIIFFANGRQGLRLEPKIEINADLFEEKIEFIMKKYLVKNGHSEGLNFYPNSEPKIELMVDQDFII